MTYIEQATIDAVEEGGFEPRKLEYLLAHSAERGTGTEYIAMKNTILLDPAFWSALSKARGLLPGQSEKHQWLITWHRFIDHLAEGRDAESFFAELLK